MATDHEGSNCPMNRHLRQSSTLICLLGLFLLVACQPEGSTARATDSSRSRPIGTVMSSVPDAIDLNGRYLFYIHGRIIEDEGVDAVSPQFGLYEFTDILNYFAGAGFQTIGEVRSGPTDVDRYADRVARQVENLLTDGVSGENITIVGFSKGAYITMLVSSKLGRPELNIVLIGICNEETLANPDIALAGRILSLYETSDDYGSSCRPLLERSPDVLEFEEIEFETGKQHGAFYTADPLWLDPIIAWINAGES
jgi:hypothetical protein